MFRRFTLKTRLMFMVAPVFFGLTLLSTLVIYKGYRDLREARGIREAAVYSGLVSDIIHSLQSERGRSALFVNGRVTEEKMNAQRAETDAKVAAGKAVISLRNDDVKLQFISLTNQLPGLREFVSNKGDVDELRVRYTEMIRALIQTQVTASRKHHLNGLEARLVSQSILEMGKENMGRLRAAGAGVLAADKALTIFQIRPIEGFHHGILANLESPGLNLSEETHNAVKDLIGSDEWNEINAVVLTIVNKWSEGFYGYPSELFFDKMTSVIDKTYKIIDHELELIRHEADTLYQSNLLMTAVLLIITVLAQIVVFIYAWLTLREVSGRIQKYGESLFEGAGDTARASSELSTSSADLSSGMSEQAAALQETVAALDEVRSMVEKNAESAAQAKSLMVVASGSSQRGKDAVEGMTHAIGDIRESTVAVKSQVETSNNELSEILKVIAEIGSKTKVINDIVFQTKLLSFNASVEAARAGEHGKGFAVVAEEVGNLAQMSGNSAREISQLLESGIKRVEAIIADSKERMTALIQEANGKVETGTSTAQRLGEVFQEINSKIYEVSDRVAEIAAASQEQSTGVSEITRAMHQLENVTNRSMEAAGKSASSAEKLSSQASKLESISRLLEELVHGIRKGAKPPKAPGASQSSKTAAPTAKRTSEKAAHDTAPVISLNEKRREKARTPAPAPDAAKQASPNGTKADDVPAATDTRFEEI